MNTPFNVGDPVRRVSTGRVGEVQAAERGALGLEYYVKFQGADTRPVWVVEQDLEPAAPTSLAKDKAHAKTNPT